jgi:hypothetical protein
VAVTHRPGGLSDYAACVGTADDLTGNGAMSIGIALAGMKPDGTPTNLHSLLGSVASHHAPPQAPQSGHAMSSDRNVGEGMLPPQRGTQEAEVDGARRPESTEALRYVSRAVEKGLTRIHTIALAENAALFVEIDRILEQATALGQRTAIRSHIRSWWAW